MAELRKRKQLGPMNNSTVEDIAGDQHTDMDEVKMDHKPRPIQIVIANEDHTFSLDEELLSRVLLREDIKDRYVVVVSVAGAYRKGKSFILDFFLRYMNVKYIENKSTSDWLGPQDVPLEGFSWRGGSDRETTGIQMWSEVFLGELDSGDKVVIVLLDTQGAFDSESTVKDCATVFALSTMISSVQIFNVSQNIQEDDLQHLQLFTEYGRLALADSGKTPFQRLQFLVRDWSYPYEAEYGALGGQKILQKRLQANDKHHPDMKSLRNHIKSCFTEIACFLMPHPGLQVATSPHFDGKLKDISDEFKQNLQILVPMLLAPENLVLKQINGQKVKARDLVQYFKSYINIYSDNELPEPKSMLAATAEANNLSAVADAKDLYMALMEDVCGGNKPYLNTSLMDAEHRRIKDKALLQFVSKQKMGGEEFSEKYKLQLEKNLDETFVQFKSHNESKNIFKAARTPAVFLAMAVICYILSGVFGLVGIYAVANLLNMLMGFSFFILCLWAYIRYSGDYREFGVTLDEIATFIWENYIEIKSTSDWLGPQDVPLEGFSWRGGSELVSTGIQMWSEVFLGELNSGDKVAIVLLDTQGAFDSVSTVTDWATVFALSTMISSVQIFNVSQNIQEDDLQHLQLFTNYGRLALADSGKTPFQRLQFLVRDWIYPYEAEYGALGGQKILQKRLQANDKHNPDKRSLRNHIKSYYTDIACFLMPHPGLQVATSPRFDGKLKDISDEFKQNLQILVPMLLAPENLVLKQINGQKVKARDLVQYFKSYINIFSGNELPELKSIHDANAEANNLSAVTDGKDVYIALMKDVCGGNKPYPSSGSGRWATKISAKNKVKDKAKALLQFVRMGGGRWFGRWAAKSSAKSTNCNRK